MKKVLFFSGLIFFVYCNAFAYTCANFRYVALIANDGYFDTPVRLSLSPKILAECAADYSDVRIYDDRGLEKPYIIYELPRPILSATVVPWKIVQYENLSDNQIVIIEKPETVDTLEDIEIQTPDHDFNKTVRIFTSSDRNAWKVLAEGSLFDFSSHIDLRSTRIKLPGVPEKFLKVMIANNAALPDVDDSIELRYKDLEFTKSAKSKGTIKIDTIISHAGAKTPDESLYDHIVFSDLPVTTDKDGNTIISCGRVTLPLERVIFTVTDKYYSRTVELWTAPNDAEDAYTFATHDVMYRIPGIDTQKATLDFHNVGQSFVRFKIINQDNPPLDIKDVTIKWIRRNLFLIPEAGRTYWLFCGGTDIRSPQYEIRKLIPEKHEQLLHYPEIKIDPLVPNSLYVAGLDPQARAKRERFIIIGLVVIIGAGLVYWALGLVDKLPGDAHEQK
jgi:hypothetical protein